MQVLYFLYQLTAFAIGLSLGSFVALAVVRIPEDQSVRHPPSRCPVCHTPIGWSDNIPVLSWLALKGRCRHCGTPIPPMYPLVELTGGLVGWLVFRRFVAGPWQMDVPHLAAFATYLGFAMLLLLATYTDLRARIIPEISSLYAIPLGIGTAALLSALGYEGWLGHGWRWSVLGAVAGGGGLGLLSWGWYAVLGREGLGQGDVRLAGMIGAFVGPAPGLWLVLLMASFGGALVGVVVALLLRRSAYLPFGPALAVAGLVYLLFGDWIVVQWWPGLSGLLVDTPL